MINLVREYIKYQLIAQRRHGIHSPFVYEFGDKCLEFPISTQHEQEFQTIKNSLLKNQNTIEVKDLGAGSRKLNQHRKISHIAKVSGSNDKYGRLLYKIVGHYKTKNILELGTSLGLGTYMMTVANPEGHVTTIEGCPNTLEIAKQNFPDKLKERVTFINDSFISALKNIATSSQFDLVFIDGDHQSKSLFEQIDVLMPLTHDETIIILDDIRWSKDMFEGWKTLVNDERFHLSMDLFKVGILLKRKHQQKEHFIIRY